MIVEPAPLRSRSPLRRLLRAGAFVAPVVLLVTVVAAGLLGQKPPADLGQASTAPPATASAAPSGAADPSSSPTSTPLAADADFPASYLSLPALRPSEVLSLRSTPQGPPAVLAVAGYLELGGAVNRCAAGSATSGSWCDRVGTLAQTPWGGQGTPPPHLHVTVAAGVVLPTALEAADGRVRGIWVPVVVLGRFATPGTCAGDEQACEHGFAVERVAWVDGMTAMVAPLRELGQEAGLPAAPGQRPSVSSALLLAVLARPVTIAALDPAAGVAASRLQPGNGVLWYIRELTGLNSQAPAVRWVLLDAARSRRLVSGPSPWPPVAVNPGPLGASPG